jgi:replicative DNA helicase
MVLGCLLSGIGNSSVAFEELQINDFYYDRHKYLWDAIRSVYIEHGTVGVHLVSERLKASDKILMVGGVGEIIRISQMVGTSAHLDAYVRIVKDNSTARNLIEVGRKIQALGYEYPIRPLDNLVEEAQKLACSVGSLRKLDARSVGEIVSEAWFDRWVEEGETSGAGLSFGLGNVDKLTNGLRPGNLICVGARPAMGKTAFALNIALAACSFKSVLLFSLEMKADELVKRLASTESGVNAYDIESAKLDNEQKMRVYGARDAIKKMPFYIIDEGLLTLSEVKGRARRMYEKHGLGIIIIDYIQLIKCPNSQNRQLEIAEISRELKGLAKELDIPVVGLCQLNRRVEDRTGNTPMLSDIRESGAVEADSDVVILLHRPGYYDEMADQDEAHIMVAKNRHGATGNVKVKFFKDVQRFSDNDSWGSLSL